MSDNRRQTAAFHAIRAAVIRDRKNMAALSRIPQRANWHDLSDSARTGMLDMIDGFTRAANPLHRTAYACLVNAKTPAQLAEAGQLVKSLGLSDDDAERMRGFYRHFFADLTKPEGVERGLIDRIKQATAAELDAIWADSQPLLKLLDKDGQMRVWKAIECRQPPKRAWGKVA